MYDHLPPFHEMEYGQIARLYEQISAERDALRASVESVVAVFVGATPEMRDHLMSGWPALGHALASLAAEVMS